MGLPGAVGFAKAESVARRGGERKGMNFRIALMLLLCAQLVTACSREQTFDVEIIRDSWGIAHVYGGSDEAVFYGAGYATAEDRMFQMMLRRRVVSGRTAEILGRGPDDRFFKSDQKFRIFGITRRAVERLKALAPETRNNLEAYAAGVNAYLDEHRGRLSPLFARYGGDPEPWTAGDCLAIWDGLADRFSMGWAEELAAKREWERQAVKGGPAPPPIRRVRLDDSAQIVSEEEFKQSNPEVYSRLKTRMDGQKQRAESRALLQELNLSHNWVVSGTRSTTGKPVLQSDPHYGVTNPAFWYEIHLSGGRYNVRGLGVAGVPGMLIGWNERCAWGVTALAGDTADLFEEKVNPDNPDQYLWKDAWSSFERRSETIRIKGSEEVRFDVRESRHGPIVNDLLSGLKPGEVYALHYTILWVPTSSLESMLNVMRAADWSSVRKALAGYAAPPLHMIYADVQGNIGYQTATLVPARMGDTRFPRKGWDGGDEWTMVPFEELPSMLNPSAGHVFTANHLAAGSWYPHLVGGGRGDGPRSLRLREIFSENPERKFSPRDFVTAVHQDAVNPVVRDAVILGRKVVEEDGDRDPQIRQLLEALNGWDFRMSTQSAAFPSARGLLEAIESTKLAGTPLEERYGEGWSGVTVMFKAVMPSFRQTGQTPTDPEIRRWLKNAFREGFRRRGYGQQQTENTGWMKAEASKNGAAAPPATGGQPGIIRRMAYQDVAEGYGAERFGSLAPEYDLDSPPLCCPLTQTIWAQEGGSYSQIVDLGDLDRSLSMLPPGISENPASPHFKDQMDLWARGEFHPAPLSRPGVEAIKRSSKRLSYRPTR
jgi:penicillin G amidase